MTRRAFETIVRHFGIRFSSAADIGCGTGLFANYLSKSRHIPVVAIDRSKAMLKQAARTCVRSAARLLRQDIRCLSLPRPVDLITANYDTLNHLIQESDLKRVIARVHANLNPGGHFIFDLITPNQTQPKYLVRIRDRARIVEHRQYIRWDRKRRILATTVVIRTPAFRSNVIERHIERAYDPVSVGRWLNQAGFRIRAVLDFSSLRVADTRSSRVIFVCSRS